MEKWGNEDLTQKIIGACINVHKVLGPGFLEVIYLNALLIELKKQGLLCESEKEIRVHYESALVGIHKIDLFVESEIVVELKAVEDLNKKHYAQVRSYLRALNKPLGLLVNFASYKIDVRRIETEQYSFYCYHPFAAQFPPSPWKALNFILCSGYICSVHMD